MARLHTRMYRKWTFWLATAGAFLALASMVTVMSLWPSRYTGPDPIFTEDFELGIINDDKWHRDASGGCSIAVVADPTRHGQFAAEFTTDPGARCELLPWIGSTILGRLKREPFHKDRWYAFSVYLPSDWQSDAQNEVIAQWHDSRDRFFGESGGKGPPLALRIVSDRWRISYGWDTALISISESKAIHTLWTGPYATGQWTDWLFHVRWSHESDGLTEVWKDGALIARREGPNTYNDLRGVYLKLGNYHPGRKRVIYLDEVRIAGEGGSYSSVAPSERK